MRNKYLEEEILCIVKIAYKKMTIYSRMKQYFVGKWKLFRGKYAIDRKDRENDKSFWGQLQESLICGM